MEIRDRARQLAARLQLERDIATFPDRPLAVFALCQLSTMSEIHDLLYEIANETCCPEPEPTVAEPKPIAKRRKRAG